MQTLLTHAFSHVSQYDAVCCHVIAIDGVSSAKDANPAFLLCSWWKVVVGKTACFSVTYLNASLTSSYCCCRGVTVTICCPGPVATGSPEQPRAIYNGTGLITASSSDKGSSKRMSPPRVAELIGKATYHRVDECWIARHPVLLMGECYLAQQCCAALFNPKMSILTQKRHPCTGILNRETSWDSKNALLHCGDVLAQSGLSCYLCGIEMLTDIWCCHLSSPVYLSSSKSAKRCSLFLFFSGVVT